MERPVRMHPDDIRDEKTKLFRSIRTVEDTDVVVGQYTAATGKPGYKDGEKVPKDSKTPTYSVIRLWCDNERWQGVPMLIKAGVHSGQ
jgi:glucose-6-phosphate 1-dehydrogenase